MIMHNNLSNKLLIKVYKGSHLKQSKLEITLSQRTKLFSLKMHLKIFCQTFSKKNLSRQKKRPLTKNFELEVGGGRTEKKIRGHISKRGPLWSQHIWSVPGPLCLESI